jgi:hypothetical protein
MRNIRRLPFIFVSLINAVILLFISLLYVFKAEEGSVKFHLHYVDFLYIIVGLELVLTLPCLIYYIGKRVRRGGRESGRRKGTEREIREGVHLL